jgi:hypothetical protein
LLTNPHVKPIKKFPAEELVALAKQRGVRASGKKAIR